MIEVEVNEQQLNEVRERLAYIQNGATKALYRGLNKTASRARTRFSQEIGKQVNLSSSKIKSKLDGPAQLFNNRANSNQLRAILSSKKTGTRMENFLTSLFPFRAGRPADPIVVKVKKTPVKILSGFWVPAKNSGGYLIAVRNEVLRAQGMKSASNQNSRLPYTVLYGPGPGQMFESVTTDLGPELSEYLQKAIDAETSWLIQKNPPPAGDGTGEE